MTRKEIAAWLALGLGFAALFHGWRWTAGLGILAWIFLLSGNRPRAARSAPRAPRAP